jgi:hypothetical protein
MEDNQTNTAADSSPAGDQMETPGQEVDNVAELQRQRDEYYDRLWKTAEFDNYRSESSASARPRRSPRRLMCSKSCCRSSMTRTCAEGGVGRRLTHTAEVELIPRLEDTLLRRGVSDRGLGLD